MKEQLFDDFLKLVEDQFTYGGKKYAHSQEKEVTDIIFDTHGKNWLFGTIDKYTYRFRNLARERDLLKIACYMYILWLKRGFFIMKEGISHPPINTNVEMKSNQFKLFVDVINEYYLENLFFVSNNDYQDSAILEKVSEQLKAFSLSEWKDIKENDMLRIFISVFCVWSRNIRSKRFVAGQDKDTYNETDKK